MEEVKICKDCKGIGKLKFIHAGRGGDWSWGNCSMCDGTGKVLIVYYSRQYPFTVNMDDVQRIDGPIHKLLRSVDK